MLMKNDTSQEPNIFTTPRLRLMFDIHPFEFEFVFLLPFCLPKISMFERSKSCFDRVTDRDGSQCSARFVFSDLTTAWENSILFKLFGEYMVVTLSVVMAFLIK